MGINKADVAISGFIVGFLGDLLLNFLTQKAKVLDAGLIDYFPLHRTLEAAFIAGGLVAASIYIALVLWENLFCQSIDNSNNWYTGLYLLVFGSILDLFFRYFHLMPTLDGMYEKLSIPVTMLFAGGPLVASFGFAIIINRNFDRN